MLLRRRFIPRVNQDPWTRVYRWKSRLCRTSRQMEKETLLCTQRDCRSDNHLTLRLSPSRLQVRMSKERGQVSDVAKWSKRVIAHGACHLPLLPLYRFLVLHAIQVSWRWDRNASVTGIFWFNRICEFHRSRELEGPRDRRRITCEKDTIALRGAFAKINDAHLFLNSGTSGWYWSRPQS